MDFLWIFYGFSMDFLWIFYGFSMDLSFCFLWIFYGSYGSLCENGLLDLN